MGFGPITGAFVQTMVDNQAGFNHLTGKGELDKAQFENQLLTQVSTKAGLD